MASLLKFEVQLLVVGWSQRCDRQRYWDILASLDINVHEEPAILDLSLPASGQLSNGVGDSTPVVKVTVQISVCLITALLRSPGRCLDGLDGQPGTPKEPSQFNATLGACI